MQRFPGLMAAFLALGSLTGCGIVAPRAVIVGQVVDQAGRPLEGVAVTVHQSAYAATTGADGRYEVDFAPGAFVVQYAKPGMTTIRVNHTIQAATEFPAANIELLTIPSDPGLYWLSDGGPVLLERAGIERQNVSEGFFSSEHKYFCTGEGTVKLKAGRVRFVDTSPAVVLPALAGGYGLLYHENSGTDVYNGVFQDTKDYVGEQRLVVRSFDAKPGKYAFVTFVGDRAESRKLDIKAGCFPFVVE